MKRRRIALAVVLAGMFAMAGANRAQPMLGAALIQQAVDAMGIDWYTVDGGGTTAAGGIYTLNGTIGQPDAGTLSGGTFALAGGFWPGTDTDYIVHLPLIRR